MVAEPDRHPTVLLLGGTGEARDLAALLVEAGVAVVSSLAGRVARPRLPVGAVRLGGFGGADGLAAHLREEGYDVVVDATHPFAATISRSAAAAAAAVGVPLLRLERPDWSSEPVGDWHPVADHDEAARTAARLGRRPFLTVGRQSLDRFTGPLADHACLVRVVDPPEVAVPEVWTVLLDRGPYELAGERALMEHHRADVLVTKDSGGRHTRPKLEAAAALGVPVVVVGRPAPPEGVQTVGDAAAAARWVLDRTGG
ncbi:cobalt-precorrin-6A reductase [Nocardioides sp. SYSU DS0663]|uniref:cobalt-precorrin-6A reductase n=1 Tax=Nocardioides sp. SYSU DS0663 TaxID=3416445 RepID=UPI003F4C4366